MTVADDGPHRRLETAATATGDGRDGDRRRHRNGGQQGRLDGGGSGWAELRGENHNPNPNLL
jgi:hypothetical protein